MSDLIRELLDGEDMGRLIWRLGAREARGADVLSLVQPGLVLCRDDQRHEVPRDVFFSWMRDVAERLLRRLAATCPIEDEHLRLLATTVVMIGDAGALPFDAGESDDGENNEDAGHMASQFMMMSATLGPMAMFCGNLPKPGTDSIELLREMLSWAGKRHLRQRKYPHTTAALAQRACELHGALAEYEAQGSKQAAEDASAEEQQTQIQSLLSSLREETEIVVL